ncbi:MAG TPA: histidine phosphatase family protein [Hyphomonas sp.]|uniref:histidine phosphatase family protein n=1 Tax=unclassified Hyphomonas TaxID=2630699 RepID=UPI000C5BBECB|nr:MULTISPECIES: histidine phosphatase family protein [unclassified Hyphomonas]MAA83118.1 histidine phosphatase family protein [Hyphomonas sp.]MAN89422.1 histidine phosphatase family protein [Hyphomonadaceae bacterium]HAQ76534.1 histidine phosphatase family protein [Hyphomonas sp.]HCJ19165.1 histidine phosphatase family protein [Hyphomonas sp.]|tara:strand:- start:14856 stop:15395 length:540 start_codon:yes stop_codon:yes gene_type:complete
MLYLVRHGEAAASWGNHPNPGLSDLGHRQAESAATELHALGVSHIVSSPMQRCRETARPLEARLGLTASIIEEVSEISTPKDIHDRVEWLRVFMGGTWENEASTHRAWRDAMIARLEGLPDNTVVFTHFVAINAVVSKLQQRAETLVFRPTYCSVTTLERSAEGLKIQQLGSESDTRVL